MDDPDVERNLERMKFDTARKFRVEAPRQLGPSRWSQDGIGSFVAGCLLVIVIAVLSAIDRSQDGELPLIEVGLVVGVLGMLIALFVRWRRRR